MAGVYVLQGQGVLLYLPRQTIEPPVCLAPPIFSCCYLYRHRPATMEYIYSVSCVPISDYQHFPSVPDLTPRTTFFVIGFSTFLLSCIDYPKLWSTPSGDAVGRLDDVLIEKCLIRYVPCHLKPLTPSGSELTTSGSIPHMLFIFTILAVYAFQLFTFLMSIPRLLELHRFYEHLLGIPDVRLILHPLPIYVLTCRSIFKHFHGPRLLD